MSCVVVGKSKPSIELGTTLLPHPLFVRPRRGRGEGEGGEGEGERPGLVDTQSP